MAKPVDTRAEWLPDEFNHEQATRQEVWDELNRYARSHFGLTNDEILRSYSDCPR